MLLDILGVLAVVANIVGAVLIARKKKVAWFWFLPSSVTMFVVGFLQGYLWPAFLGGAFTAINVYGLWNWFRKPKYPGVFSEVKAVGSESSEPCCGVASIGPIDGEESAPVRGVHRVVRGEDEKGKPRTLHVIEFESDKEV